MGKIIPWTIAWAIHPCIFGRVIFIYFSLIKSSEAGLNRSYRTFENTSNLHPTVLGSINQYEVQNLEIDIVIPNSKFEIGDRFGIGAKAG